MTSFVEISDLGLFIRADTIVEIQAADAYEYTEPGIMGISSIIPDLPSRLVKIGPRVIFRTNLQLTTPFSFQCSSFDSAKEQARILVENVDRILSAHRA